MPNLRTVETLDFEKSKIFNVVDVLEYLPHMVVIKTLIRKTTGNVSAIAFDSGKTLAERTSPFDTLLQVIEGTAEILIDGKSFTLETGQSIIVPAHSGNAMIAKERFKMISTVIKSGYEDVS